MIESPELQPSSDDVIQFLVKRLREQPGLSLIEARAHAAENGYSIRRREFEEARQMVALVPADVRVVTAPAPVAPAVATPPQPIANVMPRFDVFTGAPAPSSMPFAQSPPAPAFTSPAPTPRPLSGQTPGEFVMQALRQNPAATFGEVRAAAQAAGIDLRRPIVYGLARKKLGLAPQTKRRTPRIPDGRAETPLFGDAVSVVPVLPASLPNVAALAKVRRSDLTADIGFPPELPALIDAVEKIYESRDRMREALLTIDRLVRGVL